MYERRHEPLLPLVGFVWRMVWHSAVAFGLLGVGLGAGVLGYHLTEGLPWLDSFLNASMILGGMGPVNELHTHAGKVFAGCYALFSGLFFLVVVAVLLAPAVHRYAHRFHLAEEDGQ
ncbi:MAG: hypothetical protein ACE149_05815 [Armatimonadota bacterium]